MLTTKNNYILGKNSHNKWVLEFFPENYEEMTYIEPILDINSMLFLKNPSKEEILSDKHPLIIETFRTIRDEPKKLISKLKKLECTPEQYAKISERHKKQKYKNVLDATSDEFLIKLKTKIFQNSDNPKWQKILTGLPPASIRLQNVYILNKDTSTIIKAFNSNNTLLYINTLLQTDKKTLTNTETHIEIAELLRKFKGKAIVSGIFNSLYRDLYTGWDIITLSNKTTNSLWKNF